MVIAVTNMGYAKDPTSKQYKMSDRDCLLFSEAKKKYADGMSALDREDYEGAVQLFLGVKTSLPKLEPNDESVDDSSLRFQLAEIERERGDFVRAAHIYSITLKSEINWIEGTRACCQKTDR
jgi:hypothetical protein